MPDAPDAKDETVQPDPKDKPAAVAPSLDQVHNASQAQVEQEDEDEANKSGDGKDDDAGKDDAGSADTDTGSGGADDDAANDDADKAAKDDGKADGTATDEKPDQPAAELDEDILKPGNGKVAIKGLDDKTYYFNNLDEVPDDFEPKTYKALMVGTKQLLVKEQDDAKAADDAVKAEAKAEEKQRADDMQESWESDASDLSSAGLLPKEPKKLETAKLEVYDYIEAELKKGNIITSFKQAYKSMMYDKQQEADAKHKKELDDAKKNRGSIVQPGSGGSGETPQSTRGRVLEAPPAGVGLDAVHNRAIESLN